METTKLQLGDIVKCSDKGIPMYVVGLLRDVAYLDFEGNEGDMWEVDEEDLRPIPITPEILEKNGFFKDGDLYILQGITYQIKLSKYINSDTIWNLEMSSLEDGSCLKDKLVRHIHQLQHFMRDFEIEKEITL